MGTGVQRAKAFVKGVFFVAAATAIAFTLSVGAPVWVGITALVLGAAAMLTVPALNAYNVGSGGESAAVQATGQGPVRPETPRNQAQRMDQGEEGGRWNKAKNAAIESGATDWVGNGLSEPGAPPMATDTRAAVSSGWER